MGKPVLVDKNSYPGCLGHGCPHLGVGTCLRVASLRSARSGLQT